MYNKFFKRIIDIVISLIAIIILSLVLIITAILVRVYLGKPVIFSQQRPGKDGRLFKMYKFRTMTEKKDSNGELLPDDQRLTRFGKILRASSIDELPELFNVLKGDMSIVGPRPLLVRYLDLYNEEQKHRHDVKPGITGHAQVNGRNSISWEQKFQYDIEYTKKVSFWLDFKIVCKTFIKVFKRSGINSVSSATMEEFKGSGYNE